MSDLHPESGHCDPEHAPVEPAQDQDHQVEHDGEVSGHGHRRGGGHDHQHPTGLKGFVLSLLGTHSHDAADSVDSALEASAEGIRAVKISLVALGVTAFAQLIVVPVSYTHLTLPTILRV